jgi:hypothetical protein
MTKRKQAQAIAHLEGKKSQARMGDIMEILTIQEKLVAIEFAAIGGSRLLYGLQQRASKLADKLRKANNPKAKPKKRGRK